MQVGEATVPFRPEWDRFRLTPKHTAYLRVAEGCNHECTFCAIPSFRGKFRSKPWQAVLDEAKHLVESGATLECVSFECLLTCVINQPPRNGIMYECDNLLDAYQLFV